MHRKRAFWVGGRSREFAGIADWISANTEAVFVLDPRSQHHFAANPDIVIVAVRRPGEWERMEIQSLRQRWPEARLIGLLGEWCCGQQRTLSQSCAAHVVYAHQLSSEPQLRNLVSTDLTLPLIDTGVQNLGAYGRPDCMVVIWSPSSAFRRSVSDALRQIQVKTVESCADGPLLTTAADVVIWDTPPDAARQLEELEAVRRRAPGAEVTAIMTYPRHFEIQGLKSLGVQVLARPFALAELFSIFRPASTLSTSSAA